MLGFTDNMLYWMNLLYCCFRSLMYRILRCNLHTLTLWCLSLVIITIFSCQPLVCNCDNIFIMICQLPYSQLLCPCYIWVYFLFKSWIEVSLPILIYKACRWKRLLSIAPSLNWTYLTAMYMPLKKDRGLLLYLHMEGFCSYSSFFIGPYTTTLGFFLFMPKWVAVNHKQFLGGKLIFKVFHGNTWRILYFWRE